MVVTGVQPSAIDSAMMGLGWDLPDAVSVRHTIDPVAQVLTRVVSDATGPVERAHIPLEHACISCALREDVLPTLDRLARDGRWRTIVAGLPTGAEAHQLTGVLSQDSRLAKRLKVSALVASLDGTRLVDDLLGDALLHEHGWHTGPDDDRGIGEVACSQVELADVVLVSGAGETGSVTGTDSGTDSGIDSGIGREAVDLVAALARPDARLVLGAERLDAAALVSGRHPYRAARRWSDPLECAPVPPLLGSTAWRVELSSPRPFHPERMLEQVETLGAGPFRSRGVFWLPTRPREVQEWGGAGGQLSIGTRGEWGRQTPTTRLVITGLSPQPTDLAGAFEDLLLTHEEALLERPRWRVLEDGLEPWLGDIRDVV